MRCMRLLRRGPDIDARLCKGFKTRFHRYTAGTEGQKEGVASGRGRLSRAVVPPREIYEPWVRTGTLFPRTSAYLCSPSSSASWCTSSACPAAETPSGRLGMDAAGAVRGRRLAGVATHDDGLPRSPRIARRCSPSSPAVPGEIRWKCPYCTFVQPRPQAAYRNTSPFSGRRQPTEFTAGLKVPLADAQVLGWPASVRESASFLYAGALFVGGCGHRFSRQ
ncbi:hypothetical protein C8Q78DRAFT_828779 [Trametes maxima]|nr:hypothetical protein C8Q78DRAFT_828779 [Trametes maxima]